MKSAMTQKQLKFLRGNAAHALGQALYTEAELLLTRSKPITPRRHGALRASGFVTTPVILGRWVTVTVGYGGVTAPYAWIVHERPDPRVVGGKKVPVRWTTPGTGNKYLEKPLQELKRSMNRRIANRVRAYVRSQVGSTP